MYNTYHMSRINSLATLREQVGGPAACHLDDVLPLADAMMINNASQGDYGDDDDDHDHDHDHDDGGGGGGGGGGILFLLVVVSCVVENCIKSCKYIFFDLDDNIITRHGFWMLILMDAVIFFFVTRHSCSSSSIHWSARTNSNSIPWKAPREQLGCLGSLKDSYINCCRIDSAPLSKNKQI